MIDQTQQDEKNQWKKTSYCKCSQNPRDTSAARPPADADGRENLTEEADKILDRMLDSPAAKSKPLVRFDVDDSVRDELSPINAKTSIAADDIRRSEAEDCRRPAMIREKDTNENYEHVALF